MGENVELLKFIIDFLTSIILLINAILEFKKLNKKSEDKSSDK